jgi:hypothetical protein
MNNTSFYLFLIAAFVVIRMLQCHCLEEDSMEYFISSLGTPLSPNVIEFVDKERLYGELISDSDGFYSTFFDYDWRARKVGSLKEYETLVRQAVRDFDDKEKEKLRICAAKCDKFLETVNVVGFDNIKALNIGWRFGRVEGRSYEHGLPHTRKDLIVLSNDDMNEDIRTLTRTLIHEKVHLYQKQNKDDVEMYLNLNNFERLKRREYKDMVRANPDMDQWIYRNRVTGEVYKCEYTSMNPESIMDVKNTDQMTEHPFEIMATQIGRLI